jgi:hypothetical protein
VSYSKKCTSISATLCYKSYSSVSAEKLLRFDTSVPVRNCRSKLLTQTNNNQQGVSLLTTTARTNVQQRKPTGVVTLQKTDVATSTLHRKAIQFGTIVVVDAAERVEQRVDTLRLAGRKCVEQLRVDADHQCDHNYTTIIKRMYRCFKW